MHTVSSGNPSIVKFSPNCPWTKSSRPSCSGQYRYDSIWYTKTARCSPPCPARSPCLSPSRFNRRATTGPPAGRFHTAVRTVRPPQRTSCGRPTFTDSKLPARRSAVTKSSFTRGQAQAMWSAAGRHLGGLSALSLLLLGTPAREPEVTRPGAHRSSPPGSSPAVLIACPWFGFCESLTPEWVLRRPAVNSSSGAVLLRPVLGPDGLRFVRARWPARRGRTFATRRSPARSVGRGRSNDLSWRALAAAVRWLAALGPDVCCA